MHAALADPVRLRIVDALGLGDLSPSDLQRRLGVPSNLLAHHLRTLDSAGLVERHRSESDGRRTYLRLTPGGLTGLFDAEQPRLNAPRVVFVCTANTARSQLAAALWARASTVPAASAGTHPGDEIAAGAIAAAERHGLVLTQVAPRYLDDVLRRDDYVVTVCDNAHEQLRTRLGAPARRLHWSVPDPVRVSTSQAFDAACTDLAGRVAHLAPVLTAAC